MRIIAGDYGGRVLRMPTDRRVRPTPDRVREAWFNILNQEVVDAKVLDLFAGSGALGLEALSRGAASATFVELSKASLAALRENVASLGLDDRTVVHRGDALRFVERLPAAAFDIAFADPPYSTGQATRLVRQYRDSGFARILGVEHPSSEDLGGDEVRKYGNVTLTFCYPS